jgi:Outer membrane protein beta-barrel domain
MSSPLFMSLRQQLCLLSCAALLASVSATAQSSLSASQSAGADSSSSSYQLVSDDDPSGATALQGAANAFGSNGAGGQDYGSHHGGLFSKLAFEAGGGANKPIGNDKPFLTWGGNFNVGGGLHFTDRLALLAEYQFMDDKLPGSFIANVGTDGGNAHIWSLTLNPVVDLMPKHTNGAYLTGGFGFYRKVTNFTDLEEGEECYYYCGIVVEPETVYHFSSNQWGGNFGVGVSHRLGGVNGDGQMKLYAEARYVFVNTPALPPGFTTPIGTTETIPVTLGVRW